MLDHTPNPPTANFIGDTTVSNDVKPLFEHPIGVYGLWKPAPDREGWYWWVRVKPHNNLIGFGHALTEEAAQSRISEWFTQEASKYWLIEHGVLRKRAIRQSKLRNYDYTMQCWERHEAKERAIQAVNLERSINVLYRQTREQEAYQGMPLADRTRYEKLLSSPRPLTMDEYAFVTRFIATWTEKAAKS